MSQRAKYILMLLAVMIPVVTFSLLTGHAESYPDISSLDSSYVLKYNRQFFSRPGGGYALLSTDAAKKSRVTLLDGTGNPDVDVDFCVANFSFVYEKAYQAEQYLYLVGKDPAQEGCLKIARLQLTDGSLVTNMIGGVTCDFTRDFSVDADGKLRLVTVAYGSVPQPDSLYWIYTFLPDKEGGFCFGEPARDPEPSSVPEESSGESSGSSVSSQAESGGESSIPTESSPEVPPARPYIFQEKITVQSLQMQLDTEGRGDKVHIIGSDGYEIKSGEVGTGSTVEVLRNGKLQSHVIAVVLGDLTGTGAVTELDGSAVYEYITNQRSLTGFSFQAADINGDGKIDTSDLLQLKSRMK